MTEKFFARAEDGAPRREDVGAEPEHKALPGAAPGSAAEEGTAEKMEGAIGGHAVQADPAEPEGGHPPDDGAGVAAEAQEERRAALDILVDVIAAPTKAFRYLSRQRHVGLALLVALAGSLAAGAVAGQRSTLPVDELPGMGPQATILAAVFVTVISVPVAAAIFHFFAWLLGGRNRYVFTLQAVGLSFVIPLLGAPFHAVAGIIDAEFVDVVVNWITVVWRTAVLVIAVRELYTLSTARAVAVVLLPAVLGFALTFVFTLLALSLVISS